MSVVGAYACTCGWQQPAVRTAPHVSCERCGGVAVFMQDLDARFNVGVVYDVVKALEARGYAQGENTMGRFIGDLLELTQTFEGKRR